ncbi:MAG: flagellar biosynthesis protein FliQ [candidate division FCPU426 bacterium]
MNELVIMKVARDALVVVTMVSAPALGLGLVVGLAVSIFQAVTSIQEMTLAIIPKILAVFIALLIFGPWCMRLLTEFTYQLLANLPDYLK